MEDFFPTDPKVPTVDDFKRFNKQFTTRELPTVKGCLHKIDPEELPHNHCDYCWFTVLNANSEKILEIHAQYKEGKKKELVATYGTLFIKQFERFMSTIVKMGKEQDGQGISGFNGSIGSPADGATCSDSQTRV